MGTQVYSRGQSAEDSPEGPGHEWWFVFEGCETLSMQSVLIRQDTSVTYDWATIFRICFAWSS